MNNKQEIFEKAMEEAGNVLGADPAYFGEEGKEEVERQLKKMGCTLEDITGSNLCDLSNEQLSELDKLIEDFVTVKAYIESFTTQHNLDEDEVWGKVDEDYREAMSRQFG